MVGQEMIMHHIYDGACIESISWSEQLLECFIDRVFIGICIDGPMDSDALLDARAVIEFFLPLHKIGNHITHQDFRVVVGEICVGEIIHYTGCRL